MALSGRGAGAMLSRGFQAKIRHCVEDVSKFARDTLLSEMTRTGGSMSDPLLSTVSSNLAATMTTLSSTVSTSRKKLLSTTVGGSASSSRWGFMGATGTSASAAVVPGDDFDDDERLASAESARSSAPDRSGGKKSPPSSSSRKKKRSPGSPSSTPDTTSPGRSTQGLDANIFGQKIRGRGGFGLSKYKAEGAGGRLTLGAGSVEKPIVLEDADATRRAAKEKRKKRARRRAKASEEERFRNARVDSEYVRPSIVVPGLGEVPKALAERHDVAAIVGGVGQSSTRGAKPKPEKGLFYQTDDSLALALLSSLSSPREGGEEALSSTKTSPRRRKKSPTAAPKTVDAPLELIRREQACILRKMRKELKRQKQARQRILAKNHLRTGPWQGNWSVVLNNESVPMGERDYFDRPMPQRMW